MDASFFMRLSLQSPLAPDALRLRLTEAIVDTDAPLARQPQRIGDLLQSAHNRPFIGHLGNDRFKLRLIGDVGQGWSVRRGQAILLGHIIGATVQVRLRPPLFNLVFTALWCACLAGGFVLSYFGPNSSAAIRLVFVAAAFLPVIVQAIMFANEARVATARLRALLDIADSAVPPRADR